MLSNEEKALEGLVMGTLNPEMRKDNTKLFEYVDWTKMLELLQQHKVLSYFFKSIKDCIPARYRSDFLAAYFSICKINSVRNRELVQITKAFEDANIQYVLVKGVALSKILYDSETIRQCNDIDLLVRKEQLLDAFEVARSNGYKQDLPGPKLGSQDESQSDPVFRYYEDVHEIQCVKPISKSSSVALEIKRCSSAFWDCDPEYFFENTTTISIGNSNVVTSDLMLSFIHLCGNFYENFETPAAILSGGEVRDILDLFLFWNKYFELLDWDGVCELSAKMLTIHKIKYALKCLNELICNKSLAEKIETVSLQSVKPIVHCYDDGSTYNWKSPLLVRVLDSELRMKEYYACLKQTAYQLDGLTSEAITDICGENAIKLDAATFSFKRNDSELQISIKIDCADEQELKGYRYEVQFIDNDLERAIENHSVSFSWIDNGVTVTYGNMPENWWQDPREQEKLPYRKETSAQSVLLTTKIPLECVFKDNMGFGTKIWCAFMRLKELNDGSFNIQATKYSMRNRHFIAW